MTKPKFKWLTALSATTAAVAGLWWVSQALAPRAFAQPPTIGSFEGFEATEYYPPHQTQLMLRIRADQVEPQEGGRLLLSGMIIEVFQTNGLSEFAVQAPHCSYDYVGRTASSTGKLSFASADGKFRNSGEGFEFRQKEMTLRISNDVHTVLSNVINFNVPDRKP